MKNCFNEFNRGRNSLKDEFREGPHPCATHVSEDIDAVRVLIMQDRHVRYSPSSHWISHNLTNVQ